MYLVTFTMLFLAKDTVYIVDVVKYIFLYEKKGMITLQEQGYIFLHRKLLDWEWYTDINVTKLFLHCLLRANHADNKWKGISIKRGSFITSLDKLKVETGLTIQQVRTAISKLESTNEITSKSTNKNRLITVLNYNEYQTINKQDNKQVTNNQQTNNKQVTTNKNDNNEKNDNNDKKYNALALKHYTNPELNDLFIDFLKLRKSLKAQNTERAIKTLKNKIAHLSDTDKIKCINDSIESSWKGLFPKAQKPSMQNNDKVKEIERYLFEE